MAVEKPQLGGLDHLVLTVADEAAAVAFYRDVLGMRVETFCPADGSTRTALVFGSQKINLHVAGREFAPRAYRATPGSADLCFLTVMALEPWFDHLADCGVPVEDGPVRRTGATGPILSIYLRDPDRNLIEISTPV